MMSQFLVFTENIGTVEDLNSTSVVFPWSTGDADGNVTDVHMV